MKILFLTTRLPYPPHRGDKLKIFNIIKQLKNRGHEITLLSFISSNDESQFIPILKEYCKNVHIILSPPWKSFINCLLGLFSKEPFQVHYYKSRKYKNTLNTLLKEQEFDIIHTHLIRMAQYVYNSNYKKILDLTDAGTLYLKRFYNITKNFLLKAFLKIEIKRLKSYEQILNSFDMALVCSDIDQKYLLNQTPHANIKILYNGIDTEYFFKEENIISKRYRIIFTGNMTYFPNIDGVLYFVKEIFPLIKLKIPEIKLYIVGKNPPKKIRKLENNYIKVTGFVEDIRKEYLKSRIAISPIRFGAGTLNKILEPMALGIPVVATEIGVEGLPFKNRQDIMIGNTVEEFANAVIDVLSDDNLYQKLSYNGSQIVKSLYSWEKIVETLEEYYFTIINKH